MVERFLPRGKKIRDERRQRVALFFELLGHGLDADGVPHLERPQLPDKSPAHGAVHVHDRVRNFGHAARGVEAHSGDHAPDEFLRLVAFFSFERRAGQHAQPLARVLDGLARFDGSESRLLLRAILHFHGIEREDFGFAAGFFHALVKAAARLVAEPAAPRHFLEQRRHAVEFARFVVRNIFVDVADHVQEDVDADNIREAKRRRPRPAERGTGAGVHFLKRHAQFVHQADRIQHGKRSDAVADEIRSILGDDDALAELVVAEFGESFDHLGARRRSRNNFDELQVARRIEEMRARPVLLPFLGHPFRDAAHGQAGGIRGDDRAGLANLRDAREERALDFEIFGDDFDDPVRLGAKFQVIFEIAGDDAILEAPREKCGRPGLDGGGEARANNAVADIGSCEGQPALLLLGRKLRRRDVQQRAPDAGIGDVRGNPRAHGARAQDHDFFDRSFCHLCYVRPVSNPLIRHLFGRIKSNRIGSWAPMQVTEATNRGQRETPGIRFRVNLILFQQ